MLKTNTMENKISAISLPIPDIIWEAHQQQTESIKEVLKIGLVTWEYLNGHLSIQECGDILNIGYRGFLELLWSKGIPIDGLNEDELAQQVSQLRKLIEAQSFSNKRYQKT
jgi:predicted HTH domain antitoxin